MKRDWNSGSKKSDLRFKAAELSPRVQKSNTIDPSSNSNEQDENDPQRTSTKSKKLFSDISKPNNGSAIRNKGSDNDSDNYMEQKSKTEAKSSVRNSSKNRDGSSKSQTEKRKSQRRSRKKYVYSSSHSNIKLSIETLFELERPLINSLNSSTRRKKAENVMEIKLPSSHSNSKKIPLKQIKSKDTSLSNSQNKINQIPNSDNYMLVGTGDDLKVILNVSKYYNDLGEKIATEVINNSLTQIKHHDIILPEDEPENINTRQIPHLSVPSMPISNSKQNDAQETQDKELFSLSEEQDNGNFMVVGSGDNLKVVLNVSKYYTDLAERVALEVIDNSLSQVKHHNILSAEEKQYHNNNYIFNYQDEKDNNENNNKEKEDQAFPSLSHKRKQNVQQFPKSSNNSQNGFSFPSLSSSNQSDLQSDKEQFSAPKEQNNDNYMVVGTGDDVKVILNVSKYYNDLGEKIATEVINNSLTQIKHHDIILPEDEPENINTRQIPHLSVPSMPISNSKQNDAQETQDKELFSLSEEQDNGNFMVVGSGDNLKVVLNVSKYYTDLAERVALEVIDNSLSQVKHHNILSAEEKQYHNNNYIFNYQDEKDNEENEKSSINKGKAAKPAIKKSFTKSSHGNKNENEGKTSAQDEISSQPQIKKKESDKPLRRVKNKESDTENEQTVKKQSHHHHTDDLLQSVDSDAPNSSLTNVIKMVPVSEDDILPLDDEMIPKSKQTSSHTKSSKNTRTSKSKPTTNNIDDHINNSNSDLLAKVDDSLTISESKVRASSKNRIKNVNTNSKNNLANDNDAFMSSDFVNNDLEKGEKKKSKIVVIRSSSGQKIRRSSNLDSVSESDIQSSQPNYKKRPINLRNSLLPSSHNQVVESFEKLNSSGPVNIRKAKSTNVLPYSNMTSNNEDQQEHLPPVAQQSPRSLKNFSSKVTSSSQPLNIIKDSKNPHSLVQQNAGSKNNVGIAKKPSADIPLAKFPKDLGDSSSLERSKKKRNVLIKTSANSSTSALPMTPQPTPSPFNEVIRNSHK